MTDADTQTFTALLKERSGLALSGDKQYLFESRLNPVARAHGLGSLTELAGALRRSPPPALVRAVVEAMATHESLFFRDVKPFDELRNFILPKLIEARAGTKTLRFWSAACSTGQEPYSLAMLLQDETARLAGWRTQITATDLSSQALERAAAGKFTHFEVQRGLPAKYLVKHFKRVGEDWEIAPNLREMITWKLFNLLDEPAILGTFDVIFCRNVLIYFDQATKAKVLERLARCLAKDGYLMLGSAETTIGITDRFKPVPDHHGIYVPG
jgi:chemotaxis protein methyltransferase CheR